MRILSAGRDISFWLRDGAKSPSRTPSRLFASAVKVHRSIDKKTMPDLVIVPANEKPQPLLDDAVKPPFCAITCLPSQLAVLVMPRSP